MFGGEPSSSALPTMATDSRKSVKFVEASGTEVRTELICSTSDFLLRSGTQWGSIAQAFNCDDMGDDSKRMEELLELCSWDYAESVSSIGSTDDDGRRGSTSDLSSHSLSYFERSTEEFVRKQVYEPRLSSLRLNSLLKLDSRPKLVARRKSLKRYETIFASEDKGKLEDAFKGIITEDNADHDVSIVQEIVETTTEENVENVEPANFWDDVDF
ncbi:unnamed protein product [Auanema sp. JU1783]|nr:unnamed protein product [Auanema sp. JU1783]